MRAPLSSLSRAIILAITLLAVSLLTGCGPSPDTDVTSSPWYNFSSFINTAWKTKAKVALVDEEEYDRRHNLTLLPPRYFDPTDRDYIPQDDLQITAVLPVGTRLRIARLLKDNGTWGGARVSVMLDDGKEVILHASLLTANKFLLNSSSTNWGVNSALLEKL